MIYIYILILIAILFLYNKQENAGNVGGTTTPPTLSNEAIQNIASVYNNQNMTVNNLNATGNINFSSFKGIIVAWSGAISNIPIGWKLCDGTKYTAMLTLNGYKGSSCTANVAQIILKGAKLDSQNITSSIGPNKTVTFELSAQIGKNSGLHFRSSETNA